MADADVKIKVSAVDQASGVFERAAVALKNMKRESRLAGENALEGALGSPQGATNAIADYLGIGLQSIITDKIGGAFAAATSKIIEMRQALVEGKATMGDMVTEMTKGLPIIGGFVTGFTNIREIVSGEKLIVEQINHETELNIKLNDARLATAKYLTAEHQKVLDIQRQIANETKLIWLQEPDLTREKMRQRKEGELIAEQNRAKEAAEGVDSKSGFGAAQKALVDFRAANNSRINELTDLDRRGVLQHTNGQGDYGEYQNLLAREQDLKDKVANIRLADAAAKKKIAEDSAKVISDIERRSLSERVKIEAGVMVDRAKNYLAGLNKQIQGAADLSKYRAEQKARFQKQLSDEQSARDFYLQYQLGNAMGPNPDKSRMGALANVYNRETITPDLIMGQGSGAAARQREESSARDQAMQRQLGELTKISQTLVNIQGLLNPAAGPPVLSAAF